MTRSMPLSPSTSVDIDAADNKKRSRDIGDDEEYLSPEDLSKLSRSERKRRSEKKRRSDVNKGFDDLMNLLVEIDPKIRIEAEERARRGQSKGIIGAHEDNLLTRVDLFTRTVDVLRRVHRENEERKVIIMQLTRGGSGVWLEGSAAVTNDEATRMLPMTMLNPPAESLAHRSLEHSTLFPYAGLGQAAVADPRATAAGLFTQRSLNLNPFGGVSSSIPPGGFLGLQGLNPLPVGSGGMLDLSSIMAERNRAAMSQDYLRMLQDEAANAAAASQLRSAVQMRFAGLPRQPDESGWGLPNGRRF